MSNDSSLKATVVGGIIAGFSSLAAALVPLFMQTGSTPPATEPTAQVAPATSADSSGRPNSPRSAHSRTSQHASRHSSDRDDNRDHRRSSPVARGPQRSGSRTEDTFNFDTDSKTPIEPAAVAESVPQPPAAEPIGVAAQQTDSETTSPKPSPVRPKVAASKGNNRSRENAAEPRNPIRIGEGNKAPKLR